MSGKTSTSERVVDSAKVVDIQTAIAEAELLFLNTVSKLEEDYPQIIVQAISIVRDYKTIAADIHLIRLAVGIR